MLMTENQLVLHSVWVCIGTPTYVAGTEPMTSIECLCVRYCFTILIFPRESSRFIHDLSACCNLQVSITCLSYDSIF